jgi:hypothetical protein
MVLFLHFTFLYNFFEAWNEGPPFMDQIGSKMYIT